MSEQDKVLKLADEYGTRHGDLYDYDVSFEFTPKQLFSFVERIQQAVLASKSEREAELLAVIKKKDDALQYVHPWFKTGQQELGSTARADEIIEQALALPPQDN